MPVPFQAALAYASGVRDPARRQPIFNVPGAVLGVLVALSAIHAVRGVLSGDVDAHLLAGLAFVPGRLLLSLDASAVTRRLIGLANDPAGADAFAAARFFLGNGSPQPWTWLTYALLHGSWTHITLNAVWLLAFGSPLARRIGTTRFMLLLACCALAGAGAHFLIDPSSPQPLIGASAAVSGCMGAAPRFLIRGDMAPGRASPAYLAPRLPLPAMLRDRRAMPFLIVWMVSNALTGVAAVPLGLSDMPIAWQAHVGGFLLGLLAFPLFDPCADPGSALRDGGARPPEPATSPDALP